MSSKYVYPPRNLPGSAEVWGRSVENRDEILDRKIDVQVQKTDNGLRAVSGQLAALSSQINALQSTTERLVDASQIYTASVGTGWTSGTAGWVSGTPSVTASSLSSKFQVTVTGGAGGGTGFFTFSTTGYPRSRALGSSASAVLERASALGGAGEAGTASRSWVISMPSPGPYTFTAQAYKTDSYVFIIGLEITVQPVL